MKDFTMLLSTNSLPKYPFVYTKRKEISQIVIYFQTIKICPNREKNYNSINYKPKETISIKIEIRGYVQILKILTRTSMITFSLPRNIIYSIDKTLHVHSICSLMFIKTQTSINISSPCISNPLAANAFPI